MLTNIICPTCGKEYAYGPQLAGKTVRCQSCGNTFLVKSENSPVEGLEIVDEPVKVSGQSTGRRSDVIDYEIFGSEMQFAEVTLDPSEMVIAEAGAMMYMTSGIKMETVFGDPSQQQQGFFDKVLSAGKRMLTGESIFMTTFSNIATKREVVAFASPYPGKIVPFHLDQLGGEMICQKDAFLCGARGIQVSVAFQKKVGVALFGGEGFIMQRLLADPRWRHAGRKDAGPRRDDQARYRLPGRSAAERHLRHRLCRRLQKHDLRRRRAVSRHAYRSRQSLAAVAAVLAPGRPRAGQRRHSWRQG
jgi:DNA-directed RNA polymerase subunit RPC12/RpoP